MLELSQGCESLERGAMTAAVEGQRERERERDR
jgi:hypothetical protein